VVFLCYSIKLMGEDQVNPENIGEKAANSSGQPENQPPVTAVDVGKKDTKTNEANADADKKKRKRKPLSCAEVWGIVLAIIGLIVTAGTGGAIIWQDIIASATLTQLKESVRSDVSANRAWIVPDAPPQNKVTLAEANLEWHNAGKTPAVEVFSAPEYFSGEFPHRLETCAEMEVALKKKSISEWQYQAFVPAGGRYETGLSHTPAWVGQAPILIHGCVWYTDVLTNTQRSTEFFLTAFQNKFAAWPQPPPKGISLFYLAERPFVYR
jgi:hypothetical protein